ncbi:hypothetical protein ACHAXA_001828 [Cyclostephanos tholiformis]|uniref:GH18 domain-containing protein n=1 Tax=Cyclostephanos tholiformis TaxID=382380 RepID=A0ABD3R9E1_9STRA
MTTSTNGANLPSRRTTSSTPSGMVTRRPQHLLHLLGIMMMAPHRRMVAVVHGHGYLVSPRSRNLRAYEDTVWWPQTEYDPEPESCPHCLNLGGTLARCGLVNGRNYDTPRNALLGDLMPEAQETYSQGQVITIKVSLTAVHGGHFVFKGCPISPGEVPTQECFDAYPLTFVRDLLHGANYDPNFPQRAYVNPVWGDDEDYVPDTYSNQVIMDLSFMMQLPSNLYGDLVLIQWYYLTANSCIHEGYESYNWPDGWTAPISMLCDSVSEDGQGVPEQFWNCAEVKIIQDPNYIIPPPTNPPVESIAPAAISTSSESTTPPASAPSQSAENVVNDPPSGGSHGKTIVGYYASWQWYDRSGKAAPENMDFTKLQRVNFAFFQTDITGAVWGTDSWADPIVLFGPYNWNPTEGTEQRCSWDSPTVKACNNHFEEKGLIHLVKAAGAEIYPSIGGWTLSDAFPTMAADDSARANFAQNCVNLIVEYGFDGIDIDWEYPGYVDHSGTPQDRDNFNLLLSDVRSALDELGAQTGKFYGLTAALPCGPDHIANMDISHVSGTLSQLNLMSYDFHGAWSETTGTNAPLYDQGWGEAYFDVHSCVMNWLIGGGLREKINIGLPFYGRSVATATGLNQTHSGTADLSNWGIDDGTPQYFNIVSKLSGMTSVWDEKTWTQYAYFEDGGFVSFDNENAICAKVQYAQENNLAGFIIWELSGDLMDDLSTPLLDITNKKLLNPNLSCGEPGFYPGEIVDSQVDQGEPSTPVTSPTPASSPSLQEFITSYSPASSPGFPESPTLYIPASSPDFPDSPTPYSPASSPDFPESSGASQSQTSSDAPAIGQEAMSVDTLAVGRPGSEVFAAEQTSTVFLCGIQQSAFNVADAKSLDLMFWYELHSVPTVSKDDAFTEVKRAMLKSIADQLHCSSSSRMLRNLIGNLNFALKYAKAIESAPTDLPMNVPCSINIAPMDTSTSCDTIMGRLTVRFETTTSDALLYEVRDELLFSIRMDMISGAYETANIKKVIYGDLLKSSIMFPNSFTALQPQNDGGTNTTMLIAILFSTFAIGMLGFFLCLLRRRKVHERNLSFEVSKEKTCRMESTEKTWRMALDSWKTSLKSLKTYDQNSNNRADYFDDQAEYFDEIYDDGICNRSEALEVEYNIENKLNDIRRDHESEVQGRTFAYDISDESGCDVEDEESNDPSERRGISFNINNCDESGSDVEDEVEGNNPMFRQGRSSDVDISEESVTDVEVEVEGDDPPHTDSLYQTINGAILALHQSNEQDCIGDEGSNDMDDEVEGIESPGTTLAPHQSDELDFT